MRGGFWHVRHVSRFIAKSCRFGFHVSLVAESSLVSESFFLVSESLLVAESSVLVSESSGFGRRIILGFRIIPQPLQCVGHTAVLARLLIRWLPNSKIQRDLPFRVGTNDHSCWWQFYAVDRAGQRSWSFWGDFLPEQAWSSWDADDRLQWWTGGRQVPRRARIGQRLGVLGLASNRWKQTLS